MPSTQSAMQRMPRRKQAGFADKPAIVFLRLLFPMLSYALPTVAARIALRIFLSPQRHKEPSWEAAFTEKAKVVQLDVNGKAVTAYQWGSGTKKILLCHAWGGRGTQLAKFVDPFVMKGYTVIAFDAPAHGRSPGRRTDMIEYSDTINKTIKHFGEVYAIVGHSFGAGNAVFAKHRHAFEVEKLALIGCFAHGAWITDRFGEILNIPAKTIEEMRRILEVRYDQQLEWKKLDIVEMVKVERASVLLVHDKGDEEIPYFNAEEFHKRCGAQIELVSTNGLGHRRIVRDQAVIDHVCKFVGA